MWVAHSLPQKALKWHILWNFQSTSRAVWEGVCCNFCFHLSGTAHSEELHAVLVGLLPFKVMNQSCVNEPREISFTLSTAEDQPRFNCPCYYSPLLGSRWKLEALGGMTISITHSPLHRNHVQHKGRMEHDQGVGSKIPACHHLDFSMCCRQTLLIHYIVPCGLAYTYHHCTIW